VALLVAGIEDGEPRLFETDPSGTPYEWQAVAIGGSREDLQQFLEDEYRENIDLEAGVELALRALASVNDEGLDGTGVDIATIDVESERFSSLSEDDITERIAEFELGGEE
jgi:proteasome alpha subunit